MARPHDRQCPHKASPRFERSPILSSSYRNRLRRPVEAEAPPPPPPPTPDLIVTGAITPDATGNYFEGGILYGKPWYARDDDAFFIWYRVVAGVIHYWQITTILNSLLPPSWYKSSYPTYQPPTGPYIPNAPATGTATVALP